MFIDMHCHILPGVDDGAETVEESCEIIRQAADCGTTVMLATPHYRNPFRCVQDSNMEMIQAAYRLLKQELAQREIPVTLFLGSEWLGAPDGQTLYESGRLLTVNGSDYVLVEFLFDESLASAVSCVRKLIACGLRPVIAHPERYDFLRQEPYAVFDLLKTGCLLQVNKGSPLGLYGSHAQTYSEWLLDHDLAHLVASDCHNTYNRDADMGDVYHWMIRRYPEEKIKLLLHDNPKRILLNQSI